MPPKPPANLLDYGQRTIVSGLALLSAYGMYEMFSVHNATMKAGEEAWAKRTKEQEALAAAHALEEDRIVARAQAVQDIGKLPSQA